MLASRLVIGHKQRIIAYSEARTTRTTKNMEYHDQQTLLANPKGYKAILKSNQEE